MDELMDLLADDESPSQISDKIKDILYAKSADKIQNIRPQVAASVFDNDVNLDEPETEAELDTDVEIESEEELEVETPGA
jgi:hypothetical protein